MHILSHLKFVLVWHNIILFVWRAYRWHMSNVINVNGHYTVVMSVTLLKFCAIHPDIKSSYSHRFYGESQLMRAIWTMGPLAIIYLWICNGCKNTINIHQIIAHELGGSRVTTALTPWILPFFTFNLIDWDLTSSTDSKGQINVSFKCNVYFVFLGQL